MDEDGPDGMSLPDAVTPDEQGADGDAPTPDDDAPRTASTADDPLGSVRSSLAERRITAADRLAALTGRFDEVVAASAGSNLDDEHDPEGATIAFERSQIGALARQAAAELAEVDAAEARLAAGTYGICERCGASIPAGRLAARPTARTCVTCASR